ncbi:MAG: hypothetical protein ACK4LQ_06830 [Pararhodobacter sp.]
MTDFTLSLATVTAALLALASPLAEVFCRVSLNNDALHVFVFAMESAQEFVALRSCFEDEFTLTLGN